MTIQRKRISYLPWVWGNIKTLEPEDVHIVNRGRVGDLYWQYKATVIDKNTVAAEYTYPASLGFPPKNGMRTDNQVLTESAINTSFSTDWTGLRWMPSKPERSK